MRVCFSYVQHHQHLSLLPVLQLRDVTLQAQVELLGLGEELPEQQDVGVGRVDELHLHLGAHHRLQPVQHLLHLVHRERFFHQPAGRRTEVGGSCRTRVNICQSSGLKRRRQSPAVFELLEAGVHRLQPQHTFGSSKSHVIDDLVLMMLITSKLSLYGHNV